MLLYAHSNFATIWIGKRGLVAKFVFLVPRDCFVALPYGDIGLSAANDCGIPDQVVSEQMIIMVIYILLSNVKSSLFKLDYSRKLGQVKHSCTFFLYESVLIINLSRKYITSDIKGSINNGSSAVHHL